jgi:hypothetical protein
MLGWIGALTAISQFSAELLKYLRAQRENPKEARQELQRFTTAMRKARKDGDTSDIEGHFHSLAIHKQLPDQANSDMDPEALHGEPGGPGSPV